jgi:hypothetical protein
VSGALHAHHTDIKWTVRPYNLILPSCHRRSQTTSVNFIRILLLSMPRVCCTQPGMPAAACQAGQAAAQLLYIQYTASCLTCKVGWCSVRHISPQFSHMCATTGYL